MSAVIRSVLGTIERRAPGTIVRLKAEGSDVIVVQLIQVPPSQRGHGLGGRVLSILCEWADAEGLTLALRPSPHLGADYPRLVRWYLGAGFVPSARVHGQLMSRHPKTSAEDLSAA